MKKNTVTRVKSIAAFHKMKGLPVPDHPLISVIDVAEIMPPNVPTSMVYDFYAISLKRNCQVKFRYGQQPYDFDEGTMIFLGPNQVFTIEAEKQKRDNPRTGFMLLIHPDFLWSTPLAKAIKQYEYFGYAVNEALFLSPKEEAMVMDITRNIQQEYLANTDNFSQQIIIAQLELLLTYCERYYQRQFITRKITNHQILDRLEQLLNTYFNSGVLTEKGLPTVSFIAGKLNISPNYLSGLLSVLTGQNTQQHIHDKLIEKAKEKLSTTNLTVSEIAYELGFEYPQSLSKLFKTKTHQSPLSFRRSFHSN